MTFNLEFNGISADVNADREGVDYALSKGHSPEEVEKATRELFSKAEDEKLAETKSGEAEKSKPPLAAANLADAETLLETHPPNPERVLALQKHLRTA